VKIELNLFLMYVVRSERMLCLVSQQLHIFIMFEISDRCFDPSIVSKNFQSVCVLSRLYLLSCKVSKCFYLLLRLKWKIF